MVILSLTQSRDDSQGKLEGGFPLCCSVNASHVPGQEVWKPLLGSSNDKPVTLGTAGLRTQVLKEPGGFLFSSCFVAGNILFALEGQSNRV